jgi:glyoxylase-like metal-dependent hydrolase (beta-lactamase superfamily II)
MFNNCLEDWGVLLNLTQEGNLSQVTLSKNENLSVNVYLIEEENELTLIDTALPFAATFIIQTAERVNKPLTKILLTHAHHDHVGGLDLMKQAFPFVKLYISKREEKILRGDLSLELNEPETPVAGIFPDPLNIKPDFLINDGDRIGSLRAVSVPGHTPGSMAFVDERSNVLIAGDAFQNIGGLAVAGQLRKIFPMVAEGTWNNEAALSSAYKIRLLQPSLLAVGHGEMIKDPCEAIDKAIEEVELQL